MSTIATHRHAALRVTAGDATTQDRRGLANRLLGRARALAERISTAYWRAQQREHERYLASAADRYELERRERDWARRQDFWRVY
jgi:hypothetical protein